MSKAKTLSTNKLIHSIKLRASIPESQNSFQTEDFLFFINEEVDSVVAFVRSFHEDFYLFTEELPLVYGVNRYDIPSRASGNTLRDISYNNSNQLIEMTRIKVEDQSSRINLSDRSYSLPQFYIEGSEIVIAPGLAVAGAKLNVSYYIRPNTLTSEDNVSVVTSINRNNGLVSINQFPDVFLSSSNFDITSSKAPFRLVSKEITPNGLATSSNLNFTFGSIKTTNTTLPSFASFITGSYLSFVDNSNGLNVNNVFWFDKTGIDVTPVIANANLYRVNIASAVTLNDIIVILVNLFNTAFADSRLIMSQLSTTQISTENGGVGVSVGNNFEISSVGFTVVTTVINTGTITIPLKLSIDDIIAIPEETIIPQMQIELHPMLAQRAAMRCLESLGDVAGLQAASAKLADMESKAGNLINNRVESSPQKIKPRHTTLRGSSYNNRRG